MKRLACLAGLLLAAGAAHATVNLNTAQQSELQRTKGLDKHKAKAIIDYRNQNGPFDSVDELKNVRGFDLASVEKLRTQVAVEGPPYAPPEKAEKGEKPEKKR